MPGSFQTNAGNGVPRVAHALPAVQTFNDGNGGEPYAYPFALAGVTRDSTGNPLANCAIVALRTADNSVAAIGVSDGSGNYRLGASSTLPHYLVAYLPGSPDVAGTTVNTLVGT